MSCDKSDYKDPQNLIGRWAHPVYADNAEGKAIIFYERTNKLPVDSNLKIEIILQEYDNK